ncbi:unnamed protein product [Trichogramma brassicae]|uniref:Uncharacterized protein n=1 Tax=Trichogramma brassicae TaxID=86971 RepID=A0A6H5J542_9HYME|nr:unnamed protein product [Trichogramma brassicae]
MSCDSTLLYGAPIWRCATETQAYIRQAEAVHRRACLRVIIGRPHISYDVTYVIAGVPPLTLLADERARIYQRCPEDVKEEERRESLSKWQDRPTSPAYDNGVSSSLARVRTSLPSSNDETVVLLVGLGGSTSGRVPNSLHLFSGFSGSNSPILYVFPPYFRTNNNVYNNSDPPRERAVGEQWGAMESTTDDVKLAIDSINENLSQITTAFNKMANHVNGMDNNCENMWIKMKVMEQTMTFMMEQLESVTKNIMDINVSMKLRDEEESEKAKHERSYEIDVALRRTSYAHVSACPACAPH